MADGFLDQYGVKDARREKFLKRLIVAFFTIVIGSAVLYYSLRDYSQEQQLKRFVEAVQKKDYKAAYILWGCTMEAQCRDYSYDKFLEDWGPTGANSKFLAGSIRDTERCGNGFIGALHSGNEDLSLWVDRDTNVIGYAPWQQCPEKKLRLARWLRMRLSSN